MSDGVSKPRPIRGEPWASLDWFGERAEAFDRHADVDELILPALAGRALLRVGVPFAQGGDSGSTADAIEAIAEVAKRSLTAAFVFWGQRTFIEYLLQSENHGLRERLLPTLLSGRVAGATGLSNAMKFLCGIEALQISATTAGGAWRLDGRLPWVTNLRPSGYFVAAAVQPDKGAPPAIVAIAHDQSGVQQSPEFDLIALRGSHTAAIGLEHVKIDSSAVIATDALRYLPRVRPAFLGMQCGLSIGLARAGLQAALAAVGTAKTVLGPAIARLREELESLAANLREGVESGRFAIDAVRLFRLRIRLAEIAQAAVQLELEASGGRAYLADAGNSFARRWREAAFIPVVTPSLPQLKGELLKHAASQPS